MTPIRQGITKGSPRHQKSAVFVAGALPVLDRAAWLLGRILSVIDAGDPRLSWDSRRELSFQGEYWHLPGALPWWEVRQRVGGAVRTGEFSAAVDVLIESGELIEVWLDTG